MGHKKKGGSFFVTSRKKMNTTILNLQWSTSFSAIECWSVSSHVCGQTLKTDLSEVSVDAVRLVVNGRSKGGTKDQDLATGADTWGEAKETLPWQEARGPERTSHGCRHHRSVKRPERHPGGEKEHFSPPNYCLFWHLLLHFKHRCWQTKFPMFSVKVPKAISEW